MDGTGDGDGMMALTVVIVVEGQDDLPSHCCTRPLKFAADCRLTHSARLSEESPHNKPAASSSPHFRALSRLVQQFTGISNRRIPSYEEGFGIFEIPVCFALRSLRCCIDYRAVENQTILDHCKSFSQWLLNNPAFSAITCSTAYLGTWKSKSE